ncbi:hypothetical protein [Anabaena sp. CCY 0017]|uniref:hypothetical protein n=1 Tax=Anabaena sp. CCY 0017 TaxID=3103866 RepID=UPI0039C70311
MKSVFRTTQTIQTIKILALSTVSSLFLTLETAAATYGWQPESLKEISQLQLRVSKKECPIGISQQNLQSGIATHLIKNGIPINKTNKAERNPYIKISINCKTRDPFAFSIMLQVIQEVAVNGKNIEGIIYSHGTYGTSGIPEYSRGEQRLIVTWVLNPFISDWKSVK